jgi:hypothetical protein
LRRDGLTSCGAELGDIRRSLRAVVLFLFQRITVVNFDFPPEVGDI